MPEILESILSQFKAVLDVSAVPPLFGGRGLFWLFLLVEVALYIYMRRTEVHMQEAYEGKVPVWRRWNALKLVLLFLVVRPVLIAGGEGGRFGTLVVAVLIDAAMAAAMFLQLRYIQTEQASFAKWSELDGETLPGRDGPV